MIRKLLVMAVLLFPFVQSAQCFTVKGKAVTEDGKTPAAGIVVQATHMRDAVPGRKDDFVRTSTTGAGGLFSLDLPSFNDMYNVCLLDGKGHCYWGQAHINGNVDLGTIKLQRGCELDGKVRARDGKMLPGVEIMLKLKLKVCSHYVDAARTTSGPDGSFSFPDLSPGEYTYQSKGGVYSVKSGTITVTDDPGYLELTAEKAATVRGLVKDDQGKPVAGIHVTTESGSTETDTEGRYRLSGLPAGSLYIRVSGNGYVQIDDEGREQVECEAGKEVERNVSVIKGGSFRLEIEMAEKNDRVPDTVEVGFGRKTARYSSSTSYQSASVTNSIAIFQDLTPASYTLTIRKGKGTWLATNVTIVAAQEVKQHVVLPHVLAITGRVTDENGKAVQDASIRASLLKEKSASSRGSRFEFPMDEQQYLSTDEAGKFAIEGLTEGAKVKIVVSHQTLMATNRVVVVRKGHAGEDFILGKGLAISGSVVESDGKPASGIEVRSSVRFSGRGDNEEMYDLMSSMSRTAKVDEKGGFELTGLAPGKYDLVFTRSDAEMQDAEANLSGVAAGTDDVIVTLGKKQTVTGRVVDKEGKPLAKVALSVTKTQDSSSRRYVRSGEGGLRTGADGAFALNLRSGAKYSIGFSLYPYIQRTVSVDLGPGSPSPAPLKVELERGCKVTGTVVDGTGNPVTGVTASSTSPAGLFEGIFMPGESDADEAKLGKTNAKGEFVLEGVPPGVVKILISLRTNDSSRILTSKEMIVSRVKPNGVKIVLPGMGTVKGRVMTADGKPVVEASVSLFSPQGGSNMSEQTDKNGAFTMANVPAGSYMAMWYDLKGGGTGEGMRPVSVMVKKGEVSEITLGMAAPRAGAVTVSGIVRKEGTSLGQATIVFSPIPTEESDVVDMVSVFQSQAKGDIDASGAFSVSNMTAGTYSYRITQAGVGQRSDMDEEDGSGSYYTGEVTLTGGQTKVDINLTGVTLTGIVSGVDGKPVAKCRVVLSPSSAKSLAKWTLARYGMTDRTGKYRIECVATGKYDIVVSSESDGSGGRKNVELSGNPAPLNIALGPTFKLSGKVSLVNGDSPAGATVVAVSEDEMSGGWGQVADTGEYSMEPKLAKGTYTLFFTRSGCAVESAVLAINHDTKHDVTLAIGGDLQVTVTRGGRPVKGQTVHLKTESGEEILRQRGVLYGNAGAPWAVGPTDAEGKMTFHGLKPGKHIIYTDGQKATASAEVKPVETAEAELSI